MRYAAAENTSRKAGIISRNLSVRQDMQSQKMGDQWSPRVIASEQIHYSISLFHYLPTANALLSRALRRFAAFS